MHAHNVYFTLKDGSNEAVKQLISDCNLYLSDIPGIKSFACGVLEKQLNREVNDRDFDVSVHVLFESKETHDAYQIAPAHKEFVARNEDNWSTTRVFDSSIK